MPPMQAILESCCELLQLCPRLQHIAVVSGADIPVSLIPRGHLPLGCTLYGDFRWGLGRWEAEGVGGG